MDNDLDFKWCFVFCKGEIVIGVFGEDVIVGKVMEHYWEAFILQNIFMIKEVV